MTTPATDDSALIAAYRQGDDGALSSLVERHQTAIYRLALGVLGSPHDAEDAAQESLIAMFRSLHAFRGESRFTTWLYRLTLNTCLKRKARARPDAPLSDEDSRAIPDNPGRGPDAEASRRWLREQVGGFLAALPNAYRVPVVLSDALDLPASEIAGLLDLSLPAAKARILRGRRQLRGHIERHCQEAGLTGWRELLV
ncbi:MAG: sigma-70 family RNA polymerase sigma factor [Dehalococcoidia bacterium]